jgi:delta 1-pyrroline-5-carboxylate dehydrogenase
MQLADQPDKLASGFKKTLAAWKRSSKFYGYREAGEFGRALDRGEGHAGLRQHLQGLQGRWHPAIFEVIDPHSGEGVALVSACGAVEIDLAVKAARSAFEDGRWSDLSPSERAECLNAWAAALEAARTDLATLDSLQMGMPLSWGADDLQSAIDAVCETATFTRWPRRWCRASPSTPVKSAWPVPACWCTGR